MSHDEATARYRQRLQARAVATGLENQAGLFPPDSEWRRLAMCHASFLASGRALLLQVAHPAVAQGVHDYSDFRRDPIGRGVRTFLALGVISVGTQRAAIEMATHIFARHLPIKGTIPAQPSGTPERRYSALQQDATTWVWATLVEGILFGQREAGIRVPRARLERMYEESKLFGEFFNVDHDRMPATLDDFERYFDETVETLDVTEAGRAVGSALVKRGRSPGSQAGLLLRVMATETLPPRLRDAFGLRSTPATRLYHEALRRSGQAFFLVTPSFMHVAPTVFVPMLRTRVPGVRPVLRTLSEWTRDAVHARARA